MTQYLSVLLGRKAVVGLQVRAASDGQASFDIKEGGTIAWESVSTPQALAAYLTRWCRDNGLGHLVSVVWPRTEVFLKRIELPSSGGADAAKLIQQNFESEAPFSLDEAVWDWEWQEKSADRSAALCVGVKRERLALLAEACRLAGLKIRDMDVSTLSLARLTAVDHRSPAPLAVVYAGADLVECLVMQNGRVMFSRGTAQSATPAERVEEVRKSLGLYGQGSPTMPVANLVVCGPEAVGVAEQLEPLLKVPVRVGARQPYLYATGDRGEKSAAGDKRIQLLAAWRRTGGQAEDSFRTLLAKYRPVWATAIGVFLVGGWVMMDRTVRDVTKLEKEYQVLRDKVAKEPERPWLLLMQKIQRSLPADTELTGLKVTDKGELTVEFKSESMVGIMLFHNHLVRSGLVVNPRQGGYRTGMERNKQWFRSALKGQLAGGLK